MPRKSQTPLALRAQAFTAAIIRGLIESHPILRNRQERNTPMRRFQPLAFLLIVCLLSCNKTTNASSSKSHSQDGWKKLTAAQAKIIEDCGTEPPFSGKFLNHKEKGTYTCGRCGAPLFRSNSKFDSGSGWPSFDAEISGSLRELLDKDGRRKEIRCARCDGHLGHVFRGEGQTSTNTRHCVNSLALDFTSQTLGEAYFAGGCFWGVEYLLEQQPGVIRVESGYMGGHLNNPSYQEVVSGNTGHAETVRVLFDPSKTNYTKLAKYFFEIHDPSQINRQGPDIGTQYRSVIFVTNSQQERSARKLAAALKTKGFTVNTTIQVASVFWPAEKYHQNYYQRTGKEPYCHEHKPKF